MTTTHQLVVEVESTGDVDMDALERDMLALLRGMTRMPGTSVMLKFNTVVYETSYPTPRPEEL